MNLGILRDAKARLKDGLTFAWALLVLTPIALGGVLLWFFVLLAAASFWLLAPKWLKNWLNKRIAEKAELAAAQAVREFMLDARINLDRKDGRAYRLRASSHAPAPQRLAGWCEIGAFSFGYGKTHYSLHAFELLGNSIYAVCTQQLDVIEYFAVCDAPSGVRYYLLSNDAMAVNFETPELSASAQAELSPQQAAIHLGALTDRVELGIEQFGESYERIFALRADQRLVLAPTLASIANKLPAVQGAKPLSANKLRKALKVATERWRADVEQALLDNARHQFGLNRDNQLLWLDLIIVHANTAPGDIARRYLWDEQSVFTVKQMLRQCKSATQIIMLINERIAQDAQLICIASLNQPIAAEVWCMRKQWNDAEKTIQKDKSKYH